MSKLPNIIYANRTLGESSYSGKHVEAFTGSGVKKYYSEDLIEKIKDKIRLLAYEYTHNNTHPTFTAGGLKLAMDAIDEVLKDE